MSKSEIRRSRRQKRAKQLKINQRLKKELYGNLAVSPCLYCQEMFLVENLTIEHLIPHVLGGTNEESNITLACRTCNQTRGREAFLLKRGINKGSYEKNNNF